MTKTSNIFLNSSVHMREHKILRGQGTDPQPARFGKGAVGYPCVTCIITSCPRSKENNNFEQIGSTVSDSAVFGLMILECQRYKCQRYKCQGVLLKAC